jgi:hypothetical protein
VRSSAHDIVQFTYGEDGLDPVAMEAKDGSVLDLQHLLEHVRCVLVRLRTHTHTQGDERQVRRGRLSTTR